MRIINYIKETKGEMKHVSWPTKAQATAYTILVIAISIFMAAYLGFFDWILTSALEGIIGSEGGNSSFDPAEHIVNDPIDIEAMIEDATLGEEAVDVTPEETTN